MGLPSPAGDGVAVEAAEETTKVDFVFKTTLTKNYGSSYLIEYLLLYLLFILKLSF